MAGFALRLIDFAFTLYNLAFIARAMLSWFRVSHFHPVVRFLIQVTEPVLAPLRRYIPPMGGLDVTPMVALIVLWGAEQLVKAVVLMVLGI